MVYIEKDRREPDFLAAFRAQEGPDWQANYTTLDALTRHALFNELLGKQRGLCCYCMQQLEHEDRRKTTIEHFLPEAHFDYEDVNYHNLFLVCRNEGLRPSQQHCDVRKGNYLIPKYLLLEDCHKLFKYNAEGEILPAKAGAKTWADCLDFKLKDTHNQGEIAGLISTIMILGLNVPQLKENRKAIFRGVFQAIVGLPLDALDTKLDQLLNGSDRAQPFVGLLAYCYETEISRRKQQNRV